MAPRTYTIDEIEAERNALLRTVEVITTRLRVDEATLKINKGASANDADFNEIVRSLGSAIAAADSWLHRYRLIVP